MANAKVFTGQKVTEKRTGRVGFIHATTSVVSRPSGMRKMLVSIRMEGSEPGTSDWSRTGDMSWLRSNYRTGTTYLGAM